MKDKINGAISLLQDVLHDTQDRPVIDEIEAVLEVLDGIIIMLDTSDKGDCTDPNEDHRLTGEQLGVV